jgi:hypothetical protein
MEANYVVFIKTKNDLSGMSYVCQQHLEERQKLIEADEGISYAEIRTIPPFDWVRECGMCKAESGE